MCAYVQVNMCVHICACVGERVHVCVCMCERVHACADEHSCVCILHVH